jgi:hypothetical protein
MRNVWWGCAVLCLAVVACSPKPAKVADAFEPAKGFAPATFAKDVAGGHFERWHKDLPCRVDTIRADLRLDRVNADPHWLPALKIILPPLPIATEGTRAVYGVTVAAFNISPDTAGGPLQVTLTKFKVRETPQTMAFSKTAVGKTVHVVLSWHADGMVTATVGGETKSVRMDTPPKSAILLVTSGKGTFENVEMGRTAPNGTCATGGKAG